MGYQGKPENDNPDDGTPEYLTVITFYATILLTHRNVRPYRILKCIYFKNIKEKSPNPQVKIKVKWPKVLSHSYLYHFGPLQPVSLNTYQAMSTKSARIQGLRPQGGCWDWTQHTPSHLYTQLKFMPNVSLLGQKL